MRGDVIEKTYYFSMQVGHLYLNVADLHISQVTLSLLILLLLLLLLLGCITSSEVIFFSRVWLLRRLCAVQSVRFTRSFPLLESKRRFLHSEGFTFIQVTMLT